MNRRDFLKYSAAGSMALTLPSMAVPAAVKGFPNHKPKIKRVIHLYMAGGMSQLESFDYKPMLKKMHGKAMPPALVKGMQLAQLQGKKLTCFGPQFNFSRRGKSGLLISDAFKHLGGLADDMCVIKSMHTDQINHDPAHTVMNTGMIFNGRPSIGAWVNYAIGSETNDLPSYIIMTSEGGGQAQPISSRQWSNGYLPGKYQGVQFNSKGDAVHYINNPAGIGRDQQREIISTSNALNKQLRTQRNDKSITTRVAQNDLAFRMQKAVPELTDLRKEPKYITDMYGCKQGDGSFASNCLLARRMAERGVRYIQLYHRGWDHHGGIKNGFKKAAGYTDQAAAALIKDLKQRGMLDETLIIFGSEFGRTPMSQGGSGRDHHMSAFSMALFGGGIKGGMSYGETDELGYKPVKDPVHVRDLHATILHQFGINEKKLSIKFQGLDQRLTGVLEAHVLKKILS